MSELHERRTLFDCVGDRAAGDISNSDHDIPEGLAEQLQERPCYTQHYALRFCAFVWHDGVEFVAEVHRFRENVGEIRAPSLRRLHDDTNDEWGWK